MARCARDKRPEPAADAPRHRVPLLPRLLRRARGAGRRRHAGQRRPRAARLHQPPGRPVPAHPPGLRLGQRLAAAVAGRPDAELQGPPGRVRRQGRPPVRRGGARPARDPGPDHRGRAGGVRDLRGRRATATRPTTSSARSRPRPRCRSTSSPATATCSSSSTTSATSASSTSPAASATTSGSPTRSSSRSTASCPAVRRLRRHARRRLRRAARRPGRRREDGASLLLKYGDLRGIIAAAEDPDSDMAPSPRKKILAADRLPRGRARRSSRSPATSTSAGSTPPCPSTPAQPADPRPPWPSSCNLGERRCTRLIDVLRRLSDVTPRRCRRPRRGAARGRRRARPSRSGAGAGGVGDLVGQVEDLLDPAHEVAGGQVARRRARRRGRRPRPSGTPPRRSRGRAGAGSQPVLALQRLHATGRAGPARRSPRGSRRPAPAGADVVGTPRLEDQRRQGGRQPGRSQAVPHARAQRLRGHQVELGVDPHQPLARGRSPSSPSRGSPSVVSTSQTRSNCRATVLVRCSIRRRSVRRLPVELEPALRPAGVVLAVGAVVARVLAELPRAAGRSRRRACAGLGPRGAGRRLGGGGAGRGCACAAPRPGRAASAGCGR